MTARLVDAVHDRQLWAATYSRREQDLIALQDEIAAAIATAVTENLTGGTPAVSFDARPVNPQARMALELEHRHEGKLGLQIVPVGLNLSEKNKYRSEVLVNFGVPIRAADFLAGYGEHKKECIHALNAEIEKSIQLLILHIPQLEHARVVGAVKRLYVARWHAAGGGIPEAGARNAEDLRLAQTIAAAVEQVYREQPERAAAFAEKLHLYESWLARLKLSDESLAGLADKRGLAGRVFRRAALAIVGAPIAAYGWIHRLAPFLVVKWAVNKFADVRRHKAQTSTAAIIAGLVSFSFFYGLYAWVFHCFFGWRAAIWYALSLPVAGMIAHYYARNLKVLAGGLHDALVLMRSPSAARRLQAMRGKLIEEIEEVRPGILS